MPSRTPSSSSVTYFMDGPSYDQRIQTFLETNFRMTFLDQSLPIFTAKIPVDLFSHYFINIRRTQAWAVPTSNFGVTVP